MTSSIGFGAPVPKSVQTQTLQTIDYREQPFANKDFVRNMQWLNESVTTLSQYSQLLQKGVDSANSNILDQIQSFAADLLMIFAGMEPTGVDLGDLTYIFQALGALLGINPDTPFPLNLAEAAWHMFNNFIIPLPQFTDLIFDAIIAWAENIGLSDEAVAAIQGFDDAVIDLYNDIDDTFGVLSDMFNTLLKGLGLGSGIHNTGPLKQFWENIRHMFENIVAGPRDMLLNILSNIVVALFNGMTWFVNLINPMHILESTGLKYVGPQLAPDISNLTTIWNVGSNPSNSWVFDATTNYGGSSGSFKTTGNGLSKRITCNAIQPCSPGDNYHLSAWVKWENIPTNYNLVGPCVVWYSGSNFVSQTNLDIADGHGASSNGWQQVSDAFEVPQNVDGFTVGARVTSMLSTGTVWVDQISFTAETPLGVGLAQGILDFPEKLVSEVREVLTNLWNTFFGKHQNGPNMMLDTGFENANIWQYEPGEQSTTFALDGTYSRKLTGPNNQLYFTADGIDHRDDISAHGFRCVAGQKYKISCMVRRPITNTAAGEGHIGVILYPGTGTDGIDTVITSGKISQFGWVPGIWVTFTHTYTVPTENAIGNPYTHIVPFFGTSNNVGSADVFYVDRLVVKDVTENQDVINAINAAMGTTPGDAASVQAALGAIPGTNIASTVDASVVPGLDASKITTGTLSVDNLPDIPADQVIGLPEMTAETKAAIELDKVRLADPNNIAAGSNFQTWADENTCVHQWTLDDHWNVNTAHIYWGPSGYIPGMTPENQSDPQFAGMGPGYCLAASATPIVRYATLNNKPLVREGEQVYIEFMAMRDYDYNGTDALSRLRIGYNEEDIYLDSIPYGATTLTETLTWRKFSKTITVPAGAEFLNFSFGANHNVTNTVSQNVAGWDNLMHTLPPGASGNIYIDDVIIQKQLPPEGFVEIPQDKISDLQTNLNALAAYRGANLLPNGDFENSSYVWYDSLDPTVRWAGTGAEFSTEDKRSGTQSMKLSIDADQSWCRVVLPMNPLGNDARQNLDAIPYLSCSAAGTDVFAVEAWVKGANTNTYPSGQGGFYLAIFPRNGAALLNTSTFDIADDFGYQRVTNIVTTASNGTWTKLSGIFSPPVGVKEFCLFAEAGVIVNTPSNSWWLDDVALYRVTESNQINRALYNSDTTSSTVLSSVVPALDGSKIATGTVAEARVSDLSKSKITGLTNTLSVLDSAIKSTNLLIDPGFENAVLWAGQGTYNTGELSSEQARSGTQSYKTTCTVGVSKSYIFTRNETSYYELKSQPSEVYYFEAYVFPKATNNGSAGTVNLQAQCRNSATDGLTYPAVQSVNSSTLTKGSWNKLSGYVTVPTGYDRIAPYINFGNANPTGDIFYIDDLLFRSVTDINKTNIALYNSSIPASTVLASAVPSLDATKITTGTLSTTTIPNLDAGKITTGTLSTATIPSLDGSKIGSGTVGSAYIPALDASKVTTGNFAQNRITNLPTDLSSKLAAAIYSAKVKAGANLVPAPSFELTSVARWDYATSTWVTSGYSTAQKRTGLRSWTWTSTGNWSGIRITPSESDTTFDVIPGDKYYAEVWYYAPSTNNMAYGGSVVLAGHCYTGGAGNGSVSFASINNSSIVTNQWNKLSGYATVPDGVDSIGPYILSNNTTASGNVYYIDDIVFKETTETTGIKQGIFGSNSVLSNILSAVVPSLDASKVTTGTFAAATIPALDAAKVTTGTFGTGLIPTLDGSKIGSGTVASTYIAALDASKVTTGTFGTGLIPALDAAKVTTGTFGSTLIPTLDGSKIGSGTVSASYIAALDASKVSTGSFSQSRITNLVTDLATTGATSGTAKALAIGTIRSGANLCPNPSFEDETFYLGAGGQISYSTDVALSGTKSAKIIGNGSNLCAYVVTSDTATAYIQCSPGDVFYFETYVYGKATNVQATAANGIALVIKAMDAAGGTISYPVAYTTAGTALNGVWTKIYAHLTMPANTAQMYAYIQVSNTVTTGETYYFDNVLLKDVSEVAATNTTLFNNKTPLANILSSIIPSLDASKLTTGTLGTGLIPSLDGSKIGSGTIAANFIAALDAAKIATGTFVSNLIPTLDGSKIGSGTVAATYIPSLDASKITTGTFGNALIASGLDAAKLTTGTLPIARIGTGAVTNTYLGSDISGSKIAAGTVGSAYIASLDASKITTGSFPQSQITSLTTDLGNRIDYTTYGSLVGGGSGNICTNTGFEDTSQYLYHGVYDTNIKHSGSRSVSLTSTGNYIYVELSTHKTNNIRQASSANRVYAYEYWVYGDAANAYTSATGALGIGLWCYDSAGAYLGVPLVLSSANDVGKGSWVKMSGTLTTLAGTAVIRPMMYFNTVLPVGEKYYFDDVVVWDITEVANTNTTLFNQKTPLSSILSSVVPSLDGSKIGSGTIAANFIAALDAAKIATGTFVSNLIPSLDASKLTTGTFGTSLIPTLDGSKIGSGTVAASYIAALDASKVTTGNFAQSRITNLATNLGILGSRGRDYENLVAGSDFDSATCPWTLSTGYFALDTAQYHSGTQSLKITPGATPNVSIIYGDGLGQNIYIEAKAGEQFYVELWARRDSAWTGDASGPRFRVCRGNGPSAGTTMPAGNCIITAALLPQADTWTKLSWTCTMVDEAGVNSITFAWSGPPATAAGNLWVDDIVVRRIPHHAGLLGDGIVSNVKLGTDISGNKIATGTVAANFLAALDASKITTGTLGTSLIPSLDGSKIGSGTIAANFIAALDAAKIATGTFTSTLIPLLDGAKIGSGSVAAAYIAALDASKIATGNFAQSRVTNLTTDLSTVTTAAATADAKAVSLASSAGNYAWNPGFENSDIALGSSGSIYSTDIAHSGAQSRKITSNASSAFVYVTPADNFSQKNILSQPGDVFYCEAWIYGKATNVQTTGGASGVRMVILWRDTANVNTGISMGTLTASTALNGVWTKLSFTSTAAPANTASMKVYVELGAAVTSGEVYYVDDVYITQVTETNKINKALYNTDTVGSTVLTSVVPALDASKLTTGTLGTSLIPTLDGSKIGSGTVASTYIAALDASKVTTGNFAQSRVTNLTTDLGTLNTTSTRLSAVTARKIESQANIVSDPTCSQAEVWGQASNCTLVVSTEQYRSTPSSLKMGVVNTSYPGFSLVQDGNAAVLKMPCTEGDVFYAECYVRSNAANANTKGTYIQFLGHDTITGGADHAAGTWANSVVVTPNSTAWQKISAYFTVPANRDKLSIWFYSQYNGTTGDSYYVDDIVIQRVTEANKISKAIFNSDSPLANILASVIPSLDASKLTTGTLGTGLIPSLDGSKIGSGTIAANFIAALDAAKIATGTFLSNLIPSLDASKVTTGTFGNALIASGLDAAKLTTGTLPIARIASGAVTNTYLGSDIDGSKIGAGSVAAARVAALDASKITTGNFAQSRVVGLLTNLATKNNITSNPGFEDTTLYLAGAATTYSTEMPRSGTYSAKYVHATNTWAVNLTTTDTTTYRMAAAPGDVVYVEIWVRGAATNTLNTGGFFLYSQGYNGAGANVENSYSGNVNATTALNGVWTKISGYRTLTHADIRSVFISVYASGVGVGEIYYFDDPVIRIVTEANVLNKALYNADAPASTVLTSVVPALDASKVTTGTLGTGLIPTLDGSKIGSGTVSATYIASLDASKITTGTFGNALIASGLDAAKLTTGTLPIARIGTGAVTNTYLGSDISGSKITAGTVGATYIASLDASKISTGTFGATQIPNLDAGKITTGTLGDSRIPSLDASKIGSGTFWASMIPALDAAKITTGTIGTGLLPNITKGMSTDLQGTLDNIVNALTGSTDITSSALSNAFDAMKQVWTTLSDHSQALAALKTTKSGYQAKGTYTSINFSDYADGAIPSIYTLTYSGSGTSTLGISNGVAQWVNTNNADRSCKLIYNVAPTNTDFQVMRGTMVMAPQEAIGGSTPKFWALGRVSADGNSYVWCRGYCNGWFQYRGDIGCTVNGVETVWGSNISLTWSMDMTFVLGVGSNPRQYQVWSGSTKVYDYTESGTTSQLGSGYRRWGAIAEIKSGTDNPRHSGKLSGASIADNAPPVVNGSTARITRTATGTLTFNGSSDVILNSNFWDDIPYESPDVDADASNGTFKVTEAKTYTVCARVKLGAGLSSKGYLVLQVSSNNGSSWSNAQCGPVSDVANNSALFAHWNQYLSAGDMVRVFARHNGTNVLNCLTGGSDGSESYFSIAGPDLG